ncbi:MAG: Fe-S cluster assembly protein SufD [Bacteroidota bacterium]|jgi:Fe-S cluster assembly protein SufD
MQAINQNIKWYQSKFEVFERSLNGEKSTSMHAIRRDAMHRFIEIGFPTTRQEEWRFTNIAPIIKNEYQPILRYEMNGVTKNDIQPYTLENALRLVFIDGMFSLELSDIGSLPPGMMAGSLTEMLKKHPDTVQFYFNHLVMGEENAFTTLNTAFLWDGAFISVPRAAILENPIQLLFIATNREQVYTAQPRNLIIAGIASQCKIVETYVGLAQNTYLTNTVTEIALGDNASVEHDKFQAEGINAYHIGTTHVQMNEASRYASNVISLGGSIVRNNITARFDAEGAECILNGLSLGRGTQIVDNHTVIDHAKPHCISHELYKSILDGASKGIFNGKVFVRKDAQKTDAKQTNKTLLLSDDATMNTKPQLEIFADDVKCTHGATIGQLDDEQIFYLRSRGIGFDAARDILTSAFASDVVNRITIDPFRQQVERMIHDRLNKNHTTGERI